MERYVICFFTAVSVVAFLAYGSDKSRAKRGKWRIPERLLLGLGFFGGAVGALFSMILFRHKTRHWYFWTVNVLGLLWQAVLILLFAKPSVLEGIWK